ncbi:MAG: hypothetical protein P8Y93_04315 [Acidobacteriota bacterium]
MTGGQSVPRPEDFGLTAGAHEHQPVLFIERRKGALCAGVMTLLVVTAVAFTAWKSGSLSAALFLAPLLVAAWLVLLLPLVVGCVSAAGKLEEAWRSAHNAEFRGWLRYRRALSAYGVGEEQPLLERQVWWLHADADQLRDRVSKILVASETPEVLDRKYSGGDLLLVDGTTRTVVRCESVASPAEISVARELAMARLELKADDAVLVAPAGATPALLRYLEKHPVRVLDARALAALEHDSEHLVS